MKTRLILLLVLIMTSIAAIGHSREHDNLATAVLTMGTLPPKGIYYTLGYNNVQSTKNFDKKGKQVNNGYTFNSWVISNYFIWVPGVKIAGATFGMRLAIPVVSNTMVMNKPMYNRSKVTGIADPIFTPLALGWNFERADLLFETTVYIPIGTYRKEGISIGQDHWTITPKIGGTVYFDQKKTFTLSALLGYEFNVRNQDLEITQGDQLYLQIALAKKLTPLVQVGLTGYASWQMESSSGEDLSPRDRGTLDKIYAIGPEMSVLVPSIKTNITMKYLQEFGAKSRARSNTFRVSLGWRF